MCILDEKQNDPEEDVRLAVAPGEGPCPQGWPLGEGSDKEVYDRGTSVCIIKKSMLLSLCLCWDHSKVGSPSGGMCVGRLAGAASPG